MSNTEAMTKKPSARSTWLARPAADRDAWNNFRRAAGSVIAEVDADLQQNLNVGYTDVDALIHLSIADDHCMRMASLARAVSRSPSALTRLVDRLEQRSLVERERSSSTEVSVTLTPEGLDLLAEAAPRVLAEVEQRFWSRLTADERNALSSISKKLMETEPPNC
ncbi:MAG: MarR family transcriptional regulator [Solirubrobacterales bacterium]|nr:MarR family transcriptional regulator [Solirubrobacterales bacterium]